jgi:hypothetical protein
VNLHFDHVADLQDLAKFLEGKATFCGTPRSANRAPFAAAPVDDS